MQVDCTIHTMLFQDPLHSEGVSTNIQHLESAMQASVIGIIMVIITDTDFRHNAHVWRVISLKLSCGAATM